MVRRFNATVLIATLLVACNGSDDPLSPGGRAPGPSEDARCGNATERAWCDTSLTPSERTELLLAQMTLPQKISMMGGDEARSPEPDAYVVHGRLEGIPELGIPDLYMSDGPAGSNSGPGTAFPAPVAIGASFSRELAYRVGSAIGIETRHKGIDQVLGPATDVMRNPLHGRVFESYGEDPYLVGELGAEWVLGAQDEGVIATVKHYAVNTQEGQIQAIPLIPLVGMRYLVNAQVDERTLREIYLAGFEPAIVKGRAASVMCSYNRVNGSPACSSEYLLEKALREDWGFDGFVVSDWLTATKDTVNSANNGLDIEMPSGLWYAPQLLELAVQTGAVSEETINERVGNILRPLFRMGFFDRQAFPFDLGGVDREAHQKIAQENAEQGMVLLRNENLLPINASELRKIALIGRPAVQFHRGYGSSEVTPYRFVSSLEAISERIGPQVEVVYDAGDDPAAAAALAQDADIAIVFAADHSTEGVDKLCLSLDCSLTGLPLGGLLNPIDDELFADASARDFGLLFFAYVKRLLSDGRQDELISAVSAVNPRTVTVLTVGGPVLTPWREQVAAILVQWYPGQEAGAAIARVLFGDTDPGGRLPLTFPMSESDSPIYGNPMQYPGVLEHTEYSEGMFIGYRWYDANANEPAYPFGFGLSYTEFDYSNLSIQPLSQAEVGVEFIVSNNGLRAGWAVPQIYLTLPSAPPALLQPPKALKGFDKLWLKPGEQATVRFVLGKRAFSYWDVDEAGWRIQPGCFRVLAGASSQDLPLEAGLSMSPEGQVTDVGLCTASAS